MRDVVRIVKRQWAWAFGLAALGCAYGPTLTAHIRRSVDPRIFTDDARQQIYPFFRYADSSLFPNDYIADYYLDCLPIGVRGIYMLSAPLVDPAAMSNVVMYLMLMLTVVGVGVAANRLGGKVAAWGAMALVLGAEIYLDRMAGGLPRAFGFPVLAWALAALAYGRTKWLAALTWIGACFYPVAGLIVGMAVAFFLLLPAADRGDAGTWNVRKRLIFLAIVALVSIAVLLPPTVLSSQYAPVLSAGDVEEYPELGPSGRYSVNSRPPWKSFFEETPTAIEVGVVGIGEPWVEPIFDWATEVQHRKRRPKPRPIIVDFVVMLTLIGWLLLAATSSGARRVLMLGLSAFVGYSIARVIAPYFYLPTRYTTYAMPLLAIVMASTASAGFFALGEKLGWIGPTSGRFRAGATFVFCFFILATMGGRGSAKTGLRIDVRGEPIYDEIAELPVDAVIAGWPAVAKPKLRLMTIENVPYVSRRTALLTFETHQVFHKGYVDEMRQRMRALIDATFATSIEPLVRLRDEHQVTHMLVSVPHLQERNFKYFAPFDAWIERAQRRSEDKPLVLLDLVDKDAISREGDQAIIDLRRLNDSR